MTTVKAPAAGLAFFYLATLGLVSLLVAGGVAGLPIRQSLEPGMAFNDQFDTARVALHHAETSLRIANEATSTPLRDDQIASAEQAVAESLRLRPLNPFAWHDLALVRYMGDDLQGAVEAYDRSLALGPYEETLALARIDLGIALWDALDETQRNVVRNQIVWLQPVASDSLAVLARSSTLHHAVITSSLAVQQTVP